MLQSCSDTLSLALDWYFSECTAGRIFLGKHSIFKLKLNKFSL